MYVTNKYILTPSFFSETIHRNRFSYALSFLTGKPKFMIIFVYIRKNVNKFFFHVLCVCVYVCVLDLIINSWCMGICFVIVCQSFSHPYYNLYNLNVSEFSFLYCFGGSIGSLCLFALKSISAMSFIPNQVKQCLQQFAQFCTGCREFFNINCNIRKAWLYNLLPTWLM